MKIHWGVCPEEYYKQEVIILNEKIESLKKDVSRITHEKIQLERANQSFKDKIAHLEQVVSDYQKNALLSTSPVYMEIASVPEAEPRKFRKRKE